MTPAALYARRDRLRAELVKVERALQIARREYSDAAGYRVIIRDEQFRQLAA